MNYEWINQAGVLEELKAGASWADEYCLFGVNFTVKFDSPRAHELYRNAYRHFKADSSGESTEIYDAYYVISNPPSFFVFKGCAALLPSL